MAIAAGLPDELFWDSTIQEVEEVLARRREQDRAEWTRAGMVAATIVNVHRPKGRPAVKPSDFFQERRAPRESDYMSVEESIRAMDAWAKSTQANPPPRPVRRQRMETPK